MKNIIIKVFVTLVALKFVNPLFDILFYAFLLQLILMGGEKLVGILEAGVQTRVIATMRRLHLCNKETRKFVRPFTFIINYVVKFYKHDFSKAKEEA